MPDEIVLNLEWWSKDQFFINSNMIKPVCDFCSRDLDEFPAVIIGRGNPSLAAVVLVGLDIAVGSEEDDTGYAACSECRDRHCILSGDEEYFESLPYNLGFELMIPRINCGGRKKCH